MPCAKVGPAAKLARERQRLLLKRIGPSTILLKKPQRSPSCAVIVRPVNRQLGGAALADHARQHRARAHVAAGKARHAVNRNAVLRLRRGEAQVGRHGDDRAGANRHAVDRGNDRLAATEASP